MHDSSVGVVVGRGVYVAPTSYVGGDVVLGDDVTVMHHVVIRGDLSRITIGARVNVQDGTIIHTKSGVPLDIEDDASVGHRAVVHCRRVGGGSLIGIGAIVLDDAQIGRDCVVAAGAVVTPGTIVPDGKVVVGIPGRVLRDVTDDDRAYLQHVTNSYVRLGKQHLAGQYPGVVMPYDAHDGGLAPITD